MNPFVFIVLFLLTFALVAQGVVWLVANFWWLLLPVLAFVVWWIFYLRPALRLKRLLREVEREGLQARRNIRSATNAAKTEMDQIAREWKNRQ